MLTTALEVESGFDIVIGNPPYVRQEQIKERKPALKANYDTFSGTADLYVYFYERAVRLLKPGGVISFITSNKWYRSAYGKKLRTWLTSNLRLLRLVDFGDAPIFTAIAYPTIVIGERVTPPAKVDDHAVQALTWQAGRKIEAFREIALDESFALLQRNLPADGWRLEGESKRVLANRIRSVGIPLIHYCNGQLFSGIKTGLNEAYIVDQIIRDNLVAAHPSSRDILKPVLRGRDIKRLSVEYANQFIVKIESSENRRHPWKGKSALQAERTFAEMYPAVYSHFQQYRDALIQRQDQGKYFWELRSCDYWDEFGKNKIVFPDIAVQSQFAYDIHGYYLGNTGYILPTNEKWLLGLLNSTVVWFFYLQISNSIRGGYVRFIRQYVEQIPVPTCTVAQQELLGCIIDYLLWLHANSATLADKMQRSATKLMAGFFEQFVNGLIYELFFPDELHAQKLTPFRYAEEAKMPVLDSIPEGERLTRLTEIFERIYDGNHPVRGTLFALRNLELVRIIEGEA